MYALVKVKSCRTPINDRTLFWSLKRSRKHPAWKHYKLAWNVHGSEPKASAAGNRPEHHRYASSKHQWYRRDGVSVQSLKDTKGQWPTLVTACSPCCFLTTILQSSFFLQAMTLKSKILGSSRKKGLTWLNFCCNFIQQDAALVNQILLDLNFNWISWVILSGTWSKMPSHAMKAPGASMDPGWINSIFQDGTLFINMKAAH